MKQSNNYGANKNISEWIIVKTESVDDFFSNAKDMMRLADKNNRRCPH